MQVEEGILCSIDREKGVGKVKLGNNRMREVKLNSPSDFKEGDRVKVILGLVIGKVY